MLAIHHSDNFSFSTRWIAYCEENNIPYKIVNCYSNNIISQVKDCNALLWHYMHEVHKNSFCSSQILYSLQHSGIKVFPDFNTAWHYDDKIGQKYLLESIQAPLVPSYVFYDKKKALEWIENVSFPKVFKLKGGAGSSNVYLVKSKRDAILKVKKAFGRGFSQFNRYAYLKERIRRVKEGKDNFIGVLKGIYRLFVPTEYSKLNGREKGYVYFQDFIPNNDSDIRIIVVGNKAFGLKRMTRKNDFRASGSGDIIYSKTEIDERCVKIAFETNDKLKTQCIAYDFVFDKNNNPLIVEISFGFSVKAYDQCEGYWDNKLNWNEGQFNPQEWMIKDLIKS